MAHRAAARWPSGCRLPQCEALVRVQDARSWDDQAPAALLPLAALVRRPTSAPRLMAEAFVTALAVIGAVWLAWVALWLVEQRW